MRFTASISRVLGTALFAVVLALVLFVCSCAAPSEDEVRAEFETFVDKHNGCTRDEDCVAADVSDDCVGLIGCHGPPPVPEYNRTLPSEPLTR